MTILDKQWAEKIYKFQFYTYLIGIYSLITLYIISAAINILKIPNTFFIQDVVSTLNFVIGIYCSLYLLWRYNTVADWLGIKTAPVEFTRLDRMISLHAGVLLFGIVILASVQHKIITDMKKKSINLTQQTESHNSQ